jgi:thiol-disulfide isomerase/thioredoxin
VGPLWFTKRRWRLTAHPPSSILPAIDERALGWVTGHDCRDSVVVFWRGSCAPCYAMASAFERLDRDFPALIVVQLDVDRAPRAFDRCDVVAVPAVIRFHHRAPAVASVGVIAYEDLRERLCLSPPAV